MRTYLEESINRSLDNLGIIILISASPEKLLKSLPMQGLISMLIHISV